MRFVAVEVGVEFGHDELEDVEFDADDVSCFRVGGFGEFKDVLG